MSFPVEGGGSRAHVVFALSSPTVANASARRLGPRLAMAGSLVWLAWLTLSDVGPVEGLLVLSPLVLHPLVMQLVAHDDDPVLLRRLLTWLQLPAASALVASFVVDKGTLAAGLAAPWLAVTGLTAVYGFVRLWRRGLKPAWAVSMDAGLVFIAIGAMWTVASRYGMRPLGFSDTIVLLTGAHFHYAGFVLPVLAGLVARAHERRITDVAAWGVVAAVPATAIGITYSPIIEVVAAYGLSACGFAIAIGQLTIARNAKLSAASLLMGLSSLSLMLAMTLATVYATGEFRGLPWPSIPEMAQFHGTLNALGTCLLGIWAWTMEPSTGEG